MYRVIERRMIVPNLHEFTVEAPEVAQSVQPGNFVIVRPDERGERMPLSVADWDVEAGTVTSIFMQVGGSTAKLARLKPGDSIPTYAGPLGKETEIGDFGAVVAANEACDNIGIDTMSAGNAVALAMELYERGLISDKDTEGIEAKFGSGEALVGIIKLIGERRGIGDLLAEGMRGVAEARKLIDANPSALIRCAYHIAPQRAGKELP